MRPLISTTNGAASGAASGAAAASSTTPSSKTQAEKRAAELEALRQRSLTKGQAAKLQDAEAPTSDMMLNFREVQRQKAKLEKDKQRDAKAYLNHYKGNDHVVLEERENRRLAVERDRQQIQKAKEWLQRPSYAPTGQTTPSHGGGGGTIPKSSSSKDVRSTFFHSEHIHGQEFTPEFTTEDDNDVTSKKYPFTTETNNKNTTNGDVKPIDLFSSKKHPTQQKVETNKSDQSQKVIGISTPTKTKQADQMTTTMSTTPTTVNSSFSSSSVDDLDRLGDELAKIRLDLDNMEYTRPTSLADRLRELDIEFSQNGIPYVGEVIEDDDDDEEQDKNDEVTHVEKDLTISSVQPPTPQKEEESADKDKVINEPPIVETREAVVPNDPTKGISNESTEKVVKPEPQSTEQEREESNVMFTQALARLDSSVSNLNNDDDENNKNVINEVADQTPESKSSVEEEENNNTSRLVVLISSSSGSIQQRSQQDRAQTILTGKGLWMTPANDDDGDVTLCHVVDGSDPEQKELRNTLFGLSGIRGKYPQFFFQQSSDNTDSIRFLGDMDWLEYKNEMGLLSKAELFGASDSVAAKNSLQSQQPPKRQGSGKSMGSKSSLKTTIMLSVAMIVLMLNMVQAADYTAADSASWAINSVDLSPMLGEGKQKLYNDFIGGCNVAVAKKVKDERNETVSPTICEDHDLHRIKMCREQPSSVYNYTQHGYAKIRAPDELFSIIKEFWEENKDKAEIEWKDLNVYHNAWEAPPTIVHLNQARTGGSKALQTHIWNLAKPILEEWTGQYLTGVSLYGIRLYHNNSILTPHVDRMPLVTSAIIQVDQDVDEPWPLEVYGHDGKATNVTMEPGDMVLYESHSVIHGRPFPMRGNFYANCFIHFEPLGPKDGKSTYNPELGTPPYLIPGSAWEKEWKKSHHEGWRKMDHPEAVKFARKGDLDGVRLLISYTPDVIHEADSNGWTILHESVRGGHLDLVKYLLNEKSVDKDLLTKTGVSPLNIARQYLGSEHLVSKYLETIGAADVHPHRQNTPPSAKPSAVKIVEEIQQQQQQQQQQSKEKVDTQDNHNEL